MVEETFRPMHVSRELGEPPSPRTPRSGRLRFSISALFERQQVSHNLFTSSFLVEFYFFSRANAEIELSSPFSANLHGYKVLANRQLPGVCCFAGFRDRIRLRASCFGVVEAIHRTYYVAKTPQK